VAASSHDELTDATARDGCLRLQVVPRQPRWMGQRMLTSERPQEIAVGVEGKSLSASVSSCPVLPTAVQPVCKTQATL
jgi:hypothetical protein